jgi:hypothetical protein
MRRILIAAVATSALAVPAIAVAHGSEHGTATEHHGARHAERHHRRHHARLIAFHAQAPVATTPSTGAGATPPTPVTAERAGTIASFTAGTLTIALNDGSTVSGKVTPRTEIECDSAMASAADNGDGARGNGDGARGDVQHGEDANSSGPGPGDEQQGDRSGRDGDDNDAGDDDAHDEAEHCSEAALVPGASVREALLSVGSAGSSWVRLEL